MAHGHWNQLKILLRMLDDNRNDIYVHVDKRAKDFNSSEYMNLVTKSRLFFTPRIRCYWGHSSLVKCELILLQACLKNGNYSMIHLLSGMDLPIKSQNYIHDFFDKHPNTQFMQIENADQYLSRLKLYWPYMGKPETRLRIHIKKAACILMHTLKTDRLKKYPGIKVVKNSQWFSITEDCARFLMSKKDFILKLVRVSCCPDEMFLGTVIVDSPYWEQIYKKDLSSDGNMRLIDWNRRVESSPHTFTIEDKKMLDTSEMLFARKFNETVDDEIIDCVFNKIMEQQ